MADITLHADQALPDTALQWLDASSAPAALAGATVVALLVDADGITRATVDCTSSDTLPNVTVQWGSVDLSSLQGLFRMLVRADMGGGAYRYFRPDNPPTVWVRPVPTAPSA